ncbi:MAG: hypothetical protein AAGN66_01120 [Acidobacteriota bacterium]
MDLPAEVQISNEQLGVKNQKATLIAINTHGYYELRMSLNQRQHKVLVPIQQTSVIFRQPEPEIPSDLEIER